MIIFEDTSEERSMLYIGIHIFDIIIMIVNSLISRWLFMNLFMDMKTITLLLGIGYLFTLILIIAYGHNHTKGLTVRTFF